MIRAITSLALKYNQGGFVLLWKGGYQYGSDGKKLPISSQKYAVLVKKLRNTTNLNDSIDMVIENMQQINQYSKTLVFQFFNQFYMEQRYVNIEKFVRLENLLHQFKDLNVYQKLLKLSIMKKIHIYFLKDHLRENFQKKLQLCVDDIVKDLNSEDIDIFDAFNLLMGFKIQQNLPILRQSLKIVDKNILKLDTQTNLQKTWKILLHQFQFVQWAELRKYKNIINFLCYHLEVGFIKQKNNFLVDYFAKLVTYSFHKIGPQKMPKSIKQLIKYLTPQIQNLSLRQLCIMIEAFHQLPPGFHSEFQNALIQRFIKIQKVTFLCAEYFPFKGLSTNDINMVFQNKQNCSVLWFSIVYEGTPSRSRYFFRGAIMNYFRQLIHSRQQLGQKFEGNNNRPFQVAVRYCLLAYYFSRIGDDETVQLIKRILIQYFQKYGFQRLTIQFSTSTFLFMIELFQNVPSYLEVIKVKYYQLFNLRLTRTRFGKVRDNILITIQNNIASPVQDVREAIIRAIQQITSQKQLDWRYHVPVLFEILNTTEYERLTKLKQKIWLKIQTLQQFQTLLDYYVVFYNKTFKGFQQLVKKFQHYNVRLQTVLKFISVLSTKIIQNNRGRIEKNLQNYLINYKGKFQGNIQNLNTVNRAISILSQYDIKDFLKRIYFSTLNNIENQIKQPSWKLVEDSSILIVNFLFQLQKLIDPATLTQSVNKATLQKIYGIVKVLVKEDKKLYVRAKFVEFCLIYKQYIRIPEGIQFQSHLELQQSLKVKESPQLIGQIYFILLRLHCFGLQELNPSQVAQYTSVMSMTVRKGRFTVFQAVKHVESIIYQMRVQKIQNSQLENFRQIINPIFLNVLEMSTIQAEFNVIKPFFVYFLKTNEMTKMDAFMLKLLKSYITPHVLEEIISIYPISLLNDEIFQLLTKKIQVNENLFDNNTYKILFYIEKIFFTMPEKYQYFQDHLWKIANKYLYQKILVIKSKQMNYEQQSYKLGRFPLYMFACIKSGRTDNKIFKHLSDYVKKNPKAFLQKIRTNELLKLINQNILNYITAGQISDASPYKIQESKKKNGEKIQIFANMNYSRQFQQGLMKQKVEYKKNWVVDGVLVPYYIASRNQVVMVANKHNLINITAKIPFNGMVKFQYEVLKKCLKNKSIKIYDDVNKKMLQI